MRPDLVVLPDETIGCLYEGGKDFKYASVIFARFTLKWLEQRIVEIPDTEDEAFVRRLKANGFREIDGGTLWFVEHDATPQTGNDLKAARSVALDYNQRSLVVDLGAPFRVDALYIYGSPQSRSDVRIKADNLEMYVGDEKGGYRQVSYDFVGLRDNRDRIAIRTAKITARFIKIHSTITDTGEYEFSAGQQHGGVRVFQKR